MRVLALVLAAIVPGTTTVGLDDCSGPVAAYPAALAPSFLLMKHAGFSCVVAALCCAGSRYIAMHRMSTPVGDDHAARIGLDFSVL
jgi:hypothetical protein